MWNCEEGKNEKGLLVNVGNNNTVAVELWRGRTYAHAYAAVEEDVQAHPA
jgi:hypothetical protein